jgi:UDP-hydrolysing UDP-N-acetyl-D-glucosamine 2-epimerase
MSIHVAVVTGSRADYGLLYPLLRLLRDDQRFELSIIVTGAHLDEGQGMTVAEIERDAMPVAARVVLPLEDGTRLGVARALGAAIQGIATELERITPEVLVLLGDRYEILAAAAAAAILQVPIAHIHGGELTYGAIDDAFRHAITKMSSLHFASTARYAHRIIQMGEDQRTVFDVGALAADNVISVPPISADEFLDRYGVSCGPDTLLVTFHPASAGTDSQHQLGELLRALDELPALRVLFTGSNADAEGHELTRIVRECADAHPERASFVVSLGRQGYLSAVRNAAAVVGNSSSGVIEVPVLGVPSVDIGDRQAGRIRPDSVVHVEPNADAIKQGIERVVSDDFRAAAAASANPYGDGHTAERIADVLADRHLLESLVPKKFHDLDCKELRDEC